MKKINLLLKRPMMPNPLIFCICDKCNGVEDWLRSVALSALIESHSLSQ